MSLQTKYPIKIGDTLFPKGTKTKIASMDETKKYWPSASLNHASIFICVWFPGVDRPTVCLRKQFNDFTH